MSEQPVRRKGEVRDRWAQWLLEGRHGGDSKLREAMLPELEGYRVRVLDKARVRPADVLLDVGTGDGLIAFAATELVGPAGCVIFSDISKDLLDHCHALARELDIADRCRFVIAGADDLGAIGRRRRCRDDTFGAYLRHREASSAGGVLSGAQATGRISILEPINRLMYPEPPNELVGVDVTKIGELADKRQSLTRPLEGRRRCATSTIATFSTWQKKRDSGKSTLIWNGW